MKQEYIKSKVTQFGLIVTFILLILNPKIAFEGASHGLTLWATTVLPGLFPAMIISAAIIKLIPMQPSYRYVYIVLCGLLCGYPLGSILCGQIHSLDNKETLCEKLMPYCNISSPSFVINYIMLMDCFDDISFSKVLFIVYTPAVLVLIIILLINHNQLNSPNIEELKLKSSSHMNFTDILDTALVQSVKNVLKLGGYITIFACLTSIINAMLPINYTFKAVLSGIIEITNGIFMCNSLCTDNSIKILLILTINSLGGISTLMQTISMTRNSGLSIKKYIYHKFILALLTAATTVLVIYVL